MTLSKQAGRRLERIPIGCRPAFLGTSDELAVHEAMPEQPDGQTARLPPAERFCARSNKRREVGAG